MENTEGKQGKWFLEIDFSKLMDLRVDYVFKLLFGSKDTRFLISLLNAVFANKKIPRVIKSLTVIKSSLEKRAKKDKLSILDIRAQLDDGTTILIEMHLYGLDDLKYKTIRSWARAYGEELNESEGYSTQPPVISVSFVNGSLDDGENQKIHKCCRIMDMDDHTVFTDALELHYIDMKLFVKTINRNGGIGKCGIQEIMLAKWLAVITEKDIEDKSIIENICEEQGEIAMAVSTLARLSEDKFKRQAYQKRQDEIMLYNKRLSDLTLRAEQAEHREAQEQRRAEQEQRRAEQEQRRAEQEQRRADKAESALAEKDALIAQLKAQLDEK